MKIQLLYLDPYEDPASAREKLRWVQADRVVLVWPGYGRILTRRLDLKLAQREAARHGALLGVLAHDPRVRQHAADLGIAVFDDLNAISPEGWAAARPPQAVFPPHPSRKGLPARPHPRSPTTAAPRWGDASRAGWMGIVILALLALSVVVGPAAVVRLTPASVERSTTVAVVLSSRTPGGVGTAWVPSRRLEVDSEGELRLPTRGSVSAPANSAEGEARFTNGTNVELRIPEGTGVRTLGTQSHRFETLREGLLPAGPGTEVLVPIRAARPGEQGNVPAGAISAVEGTLGLQVTVTNPEPTLGGSSELRQGATSADLDEVRAALERQLLQEANARLLDLLQENEVLAPDSIRIGRVLRFDHTPEIGTPSESLSARLGLRVVATAYDAAVLRRLGAAALAESVGPGSTLFADSVRVELSPAGAPGIESQSTSALVRGLAYDSAGSEGLTGQIAGRTLGVAATILQSRLSLTSPPLIRLWPSWWPLMPLLPWRIQPQWVRGDG